jgi:hypothetical protein
LKRKCKFCKSAWKIWELCIDSMKKNLSLIIKC